MFTYKLLHLYNKALASLAKRLQRLPQDSVPIFGVGCGVLVYPWAKYPSIWANTPPPCLNLWNTGV